MSEYQPDQELDCSGLVCPMPVIKTSATIKKIDIGQVLKVVATDPGSFQDMEAWARQTGQELLTKNDEDGKYVFFIKRAK